MPGKKKKIAVYTAVFGGYDELREPLFKSEECDFYCFTDSEKVFKGWKTVTVRPELKPALMNRKYKMLAHRFLKEYPYSVYVDGNVILKQCPCGLVKKYMKNSVFAAPRHFKRASALAEALECAALGKVSAGQAAEQMAFYASAGYDIRDGLTENNILIRKHGDSRLKAAMETWWSEFNSRTQRDQLSLGYALWKAGIKPAVMAESARDGNRWFGYENHSSFSGRGFIERAASRIKSALLRFYLSMTFAGMVDSRVRVLKK